MAHNGTQWQCNRFQCHPQQQSIHKIRINRRVYWTCDMFCGCHSLPLALHASQNTNAHNHQFNISMSERRKSLYEIQINNPLAYRVTGHRVLCAQWASLHMHWIWWMYMDGVRSQLSSYTQRILYWIYFIMNVECWYFFHARLVLHAKP